jgi:hypothetical protein
MAPTARGRELLSSVFRCALRRSANQRDAHRGRCRFRVKTSWEEEEAKKRFYGTSAPRPRGRGKPATTTTTSSSSFSSQDDHGSLRAKAKRRNPRMSVIEAVSAAIGSFAMGSLAAYLVEQQEEERQQQQQQKEREEKEKRQNDTNEKEKKTKSSTWRIFKEAKAEAAASPAKRIRNGKICARNAVDERGSIETRVRASYKDNVCHVIDFLDNQPGRREA